MEAVRGWVWIFSGIAQCKLHFFNTVFSLYLYYIAIFNGTRTLYLGFHQ